MSPSVTVESDLTLHDICILHGWFYGLTPLNLLSLALSIHTSSALTVIVSPSHLVLSIYQPDCFSHSMTLKWLTAILGPFTCTAEDALDEGKVVLLDEKPTDDIRQTAKHFVSTLITLRKNGPAKDTVLRRPIGTLLSRHWKRPWLLMFWPG